MKLLSETINRIQPVDQELLAEAQRLLDNKTKPLGSLGRLEEFARRFAAITGSLAINPPRQIRLYPGTITVRFGAPIIAQNAKSADLHDRVQAAITALLEAPC